MAITKGTPRTVYKTPNPEFEISECYEIWIETFPGTADPLRCWIVRELHGFYEEDTKDFHHKVETLHPTDKQHLLTREEAIREAGNQVILRAREGFHFLFTMDLEKDAPPWYSRFEVVLPDGELKPLP